MLAYLRRTPKEEIANALARPEKIEPLQIDALEIAPLDVPSTGAPSTDQN